MESPHRLVSLALQSHVFDGAAARVRHAVQQEAVDGVADAEDEDARCASVLALCWVARLAF
jgi:hypothetical protein